MFDLTIFHRALADYEAAVTLSENTKYNRYKMEICAYHLEQCVEKVLTGYLTIAGNITAENTTVVELLQKTDTSESVCTVTDWIFMNPDVLDRWKEAYLYNKECELQLQFLKDAVSAVGVFMHLNGVSYDYTLEETTFMPKEIFSKVDMSFASRPAFEWHILYKVYVNPKGFTEIPFDMEVYYKALNIADKESELKRLMSAYQTTDMSVISEKAKVIAQLYTNTEL